MLLVGVRGEWSGLVLEPVCAPCKKTVNPILVNGEHLLAIVEDLGADCVSGITGLPVS